MRSRLVSRECEECVEEWQVCRDGQGERPDDGGFLLHPAAEESYWCVLSRGDTELWFRNIIPVAPWWFEFRETRPQVGRKT